MSQEKAKSLQKIDQTIKELENDVFNIRFIRELNSRASDDELFETWRELTKAGYKIQETTKIIVELINNH